jgi:mRNA-degrading endonuclease RelE of RelBE toxin-antitoxin system
VYEVYLERSAERDLKHLLVDDFHRIIFHIEALSKNPRPSGCRKIAGSKKTIGVFGLAIIGSFMRLMRKKRL